MGSPEHLFISYTWADSAFADWLALRLTAEGYKVWIDRQKILAGQNWVDEATLAIKNLACRVLGLMSPQSIQRPSPRGEWKLAADLQKERNLQQFFMPLKIEQFQSTDLPFTLQETNYIHFHRGWAKGLEQLLRELRDGQVPRDQTGGFARLRDWRTSYQKVQQKPEALWSNEADFRIYPDHIRLYEFNAKELPDDWIQQEHSAGKYWAFHPPRTTPRLAPLEVVRWHDGQAIKASSLRDVFVALARKHILAHSMSKGLRLSGNGQYLYFPFDLLPNNEIHFTTYNGKVVPKTVAGIRNRTRPDGSKIPMHYHIAPVYSVRAPRSGHPLVVLNTRVMVTDAQGQPFTGRAVVGRRKFVCKSWFNHDWLSILLAVHEFLFANQAITDWSGHPIFKLGPFRKYEAPHGLDDAAIAPGDEVDMELIYAGDDEDE